ncbi:hypothetical protein [Paenibacillus sp. A14]|uniref:hypothetical protein n=1 Tax=Paenibacillus sp. A14 TaxID=3119820 RepID=UPI000FAD6488
MKASEIQKARIAEIENQADLMIKEIKVATLTSITRQHILKTIPKLRCVTLKTLIKQI